MSRDIGVDLGGSFGKFRVSWKEVGKMESVREEGTEPSSQEVEREGICMCIGMQS